MLTIDTRGIKRRTIFIEIKDLMPFVNKYITKKAANCAVIDSKNACRRIAFLFLKEFIVLYNVSILPLIFKRLAKRLNGEKRVANLLLKKKMSANNNAANIAIVNHIKDLVLMYL